MNSGIVSFEGNLGLSIKAHTSGLLDPLIGPDYLSKGRELPIMDYMQAFESDELAEVIAGPEFDFEENNFRIDRDASWKEVTHNGRTIYVNPDGDVIEIDGEQYFTPHAGFIEAKGEIIIPSKEQIDFLNKKHGGEIGRYGGADNLIEKKKIKFLGWIDAFYNLKGVGCVGAYLIRGNIGVSGPNVGFFSKEEGFDFQSRYLGEFFPIRGIKYKEKFKS